MLLVSTKVVKVIVSSHASRKDLQMWGRREKKANADDFVKWSVRSLLAA